MTTTKRRGGVGRIVQRLGGLAYELTPQVFAVASFALGAVMLLSAVTPAFSGRLQALNQISAPILIDLSHFAASVTGFMLLLVSAGLWRRRRGAYYAALFGLMLGAVFSLMKGLDWEEAAELTLAAALLLPCRAAFNRRSRLGEPLQPGWLLMLAAAVAAMLWLGFFTYRDTAYADELWWTFLSDKQASGFLRAGAVLAILTLAVAMRSLLTAPGARSHARAGLEDIAQARAALAEADTASPEAGLALLGDKALLFSPSGRSFIAYRVRGRRWIAMGEPAGLREERLELLWAFAEMADSYGGAPVFYSVGEGMLADLATLGLAVRKVGEAAVIDAEQFSTEGKGKQNAQRRQAGPAGRGENGRLHERHVFCFMADFIVSAAELARPCDRREKARRSGPCTARSGAWRKVSAAGASLAGRRPRAAYFLRSCAIRLLASWIMRSKPPAIDPSV